MLGKQASKSMSVSVSEEESSGGADGAVGVTGSLAGFVVEVSFCVSPLPPGTRIVVMRIDRKSRTIYSVGSIK